MKSLLPEQKAINQFELKLTALARRLASDRAVRKSTVIGAIAGVYSAAASASAKLQDTAGLAYVEELNHIVESASVITPDVLKSLAEITASAHSHYEEIGTQLGYLILRVGGGTGKPPIDLSSILG